MSEYKLSEKILVSDCILLNKISVTGLLTVLVVALVTSYIVCGTGQNDAGIDSIKVEKYTAVLENRISLDSVAGTYCGVLPPDVETTLTLK